MDQVTPEIAAHIVKTYLLPMFDGRYSRTKSPDGKPTVLDELELAVNLNTLLDKTRTELAAVIA